MSNIGEVRKRISETQSTFSHISSFDEDAIVRLTEKIVSTFMHGGKIAFLGNGGSAAEAMHLAAEFTGKCVHDHRPLPAICLNESQSALTAVGNDYGFEKIFSRQIQAHLSENDILICLSTSGKSKNVVEAITTAIKKGVQVVLWMGNYECEIPGIEVWKVPSESTPRIQEVHLAWGHILAEVVELSF